MEIYGQTGYVLIPQRNQMMIRTESMREENHLTPPTPKGSDADQIAYLAAVVRGEIKPSGLSSLPVNLIVVEILDAAHRSARSGKRIDL